jgi:transcriptional regulator with XRE-family HTH domain
MSLNPANQRLAVGIGANIQEARLILSMSAETVARHLKVSIPQVGHWENGTRFISSVNVFRLAKLLGQPVEFFYKNLHDPAVKPLKLNSPELRQARALTIVFLLSED